MHRIAGIHCSFYLSKAAVYRSHGRKLPIQFSARSERRPGVPHICMGPCLEPNVNQIGGVPLSPPSVSPALILASCPRALLRPWVLSSWVRASPECTSSSPHPYATLMAKPTARQTHRCRMYTSVDVFQTVSKGQAPHKTYGKSLIGRIIWW